MKNQKITSSWGKVAKWYDKLLEENDDTYQTKVILPNLLRILDIKQGEKIIDIACGQGFFTRIFKEAGAYVTGVDISKELISIAREKTGKDIPFYVFPSHKLSFAKDGSFDTAVIVLAIQNIEKMDETFAEVKRVLNKNGCMILVLNHPAFRIPKNSSWDYDEKSQTQYRRIDKYLSDSKVIIDMHPGIKNSEKTISYHRSLQNISKSLFKNGFAISKLEEWISHRTSEKGVRQKAEDTARKEIPLFMAVEVRII
jgi:ubiquinone/menaquinone biosynthesis C-methylase UbiE